MTIVTRLLHASLLVEDLARARAFYEGVLGLSASPQRPEMRFAGVWYDIGACQIHLLRLPNPEAGLARPEHGGRDRHIALAVTDIAQLKARFDHAGVAYTSSQSGRPALFCRDPDGNALEFVEI
ncbi:glyoxalase [Sulfuriferula plumbiphila]|uniref:Glyoxalase n=1 Tax=Sulfuriferula plumbiphila TaxID=171865 RepID=A0A512L920_9PROT|nr:VOC family protein [Sulfuriferula plumbiphila]BBP04421.1 glyoxalase [Sulfuriferula plumbiphila]GEP30962.1 glyoxalase [Sulfuriferula plumbiphila]